MEVGVGVPLAGRFSVAVSHRLPVKVKNGLHLQLVAISVGLW